MEFDENGNPLPLVIVGPNGSGKSYTLSVILDCFITMRSLFLHNNPEMAEGKLFKPINRGAIRFDTKSYSLAQISLKSKILNELKFTELLVQPDDNGEYNVPKDFNRPQNFDDSRMKTIGVSKSLSSKNSNEIQSSLKNFVFAYYPTNRSEMPGWLSKDSTSKLDLNFRYTDEAQYSFWRSKLVEDISMWFLDVALDAELYDREKLSDLPDRQSVYKTVTGKNRKIIRHLNSILTQILTTGKDDIGSARLAIAHRSKVGRLLLVNGSLTSENKEVTLANSLKDLSSGELSLLCIFSDIIRLAELQSWDRENLADIEGLILIDEADLHLHIGLQKDVFSSLMALMPKIQFILTTHSPLLTIGAANLGAKIIELPRGTTINASDFIEFQKAYEFFVGTDKQFKKELDRVQHKINQIEKPLIITEGKLDWKYLKLAKEKLVSSGKLNDFDAEFHEYEETMGDSELEKLYNTLLRVPLPHPVIFVFDRDVPKYIKKFEPDDKDFLLQNQIAGLCLAVPEHRNKEDLICIEHLLTNETLNATIPNTKKRLRFYHEIGYENDKKTAFIRDNPNEESLKIYDHDVDNIGFEDGSEKGNLAVSKSVFFSEIVLKEVNGSPNLDGFLATLVRISTAISSIRDSDAA
ncbi:MAG: AAA family ATPase [Lentilitoribacter sp.]